ncbi:PAS domain S-box protein [uncultured Arcobacter sp.]|uniref:PAS domain S-box protein n=1 Tax=uncultured Arcobacter sp. TaxID=165434 RepID=UPI0026328797|nr:PAS domain S-box protein [uncultured Arcobacter sp.]
MKNTQTKKYKLSLFLTLALIITISVTSILTINAAYNYYHIKNRIIDEIKDNSNEAILSLKSNITNLIISYSINEYEKLIINELQSKDIFAIIVKDYAMGKILGKDVYITGKIKNSEVNILDYNIKDKNQNKLLENAFFTKSVNITNSSNEILGTLSIYITNNEIEKELKKIVSDTLFNTILLSIFLTLFLYISIRYYILNPISNIINTINDGDGTGIPNTLIPDSSSKEVSALTNSINTMIKSIKTSRDNLEKNEHRLEYLLELSPIAVRIAKNRGEYVIFANKAYSKLLHLKEGTISGKNPKDYYVNKDTYEHIIKTLENGDRIYNIMIELNIENKQTWALASYMNIDFDGEKAIIGWFYDVTNEKVNEASLYKALELQTTIFDNSGYLMISTDKNGIIQQFNKEAEKLLGYEAKEVINIHTPEIFHLKSEIILKAEYLSKELNKKIQKGFEVFVEKTKLGLKNENEWTYISKKGEHIPVLLNITALKNKNDETYGYLGIAQDISQRKALESQSKLASMGEMIGNIAHQWRQPLSMISTIASGILVKNELNITDNVDVSSNMEKIISQTKYLSNTIDDFRNFIKENNDKERISLVNTIEKSLSIIKPSISNNHINLIVNLKDDIYIDGFENQLIQAFINILNNAKDALKEKTVDKDKLIFVETQFIKDELFLIIKDSAGGIKDDIIHKIFEPYFTTKHKSIGTGIGLSMAYQIIAEHHNATIEVFNSTYEYNDKTHTGAYFQITFKDACLI